MIVKHDYHLHPAQVMQFCPICEAILSKNPMPDGTIMFVCSCTHKFEGKPNDTLMASGSINGIDSVQRYIEFIENSPFDAARNLVMRGCPKCKMPVMTMIRIGDNETTMYTCDCGYHE